MSGTASGGNSMSTTGPITRAIRPTPGARSAAAVSEAAVRVMSSLASLVLALDAGCQLEARASAPETISLISWVISAWRAVLARRV